MPNYCYTHDDTTGLSWRTVHPDYAPEEGEFLSSPAPASAEQLEERFPSYSSKKEKLLHYAADQLDNYENAGIRVNVGTDAAPRVVRICSDIACYCRVMLAYKFLQRHPERSMSLITGFGFREVFNKPEVEILMLACEEHTGSGYAAHADAIIGIRKEALKTEAHVRALSWPHLPPQGKPE